MFSSWALIKIIINKLILLAISGPIMSDWHTLNKVHNHKAPAKRLQHANATYRNIVGRNMLCAFYHRVATCCEVCWVLLAQIWPFSNLSQQHPTYRNTSQHGGQTHATRCAQQCCDMLHWHVAIVWPGLNAILSCISNWPSEVISVIPFQPAMFWSVPSSETLQISNKDYVKLMFYIF